MLTHLINIIINNDFKEYGPVFKYFEIGLVINNHYDIQIELFNETNIILSYNNNTNTILSCYCITCDNIRKLKETWKKDKENNKYDETIYSINNIIEDTIINFIKYNQKDLYEYLKLGMTND